jgi:hypothetical protein
VRIALDVNEAADAVFDNDLKDNRDCESRALLQASVE